MTALAHWPVMEFAEAFTVVSDGGRRVAQHDYLAHGAVPVVDQGQDFIGGYTNEVDLAFKGQLPVIVFGDHTRRIKIVDFPFAVGAQGVKLLHPAPGINPRFAYWMLQSVRLEDRGYGRHFALLRKQRFALPPSAEQRRIVDILETHLSRLDAADSLLTSARAKMLALDDAILSSALFADLAEVASDRSRVTVGEVAVVDSGPAFRSSLFGGPGDGTRLLRGDNIEPGALRWGRTKSWPDSQLEGFEHLLVAEGDIILAMDRPVVSAGLKLARVTAADTPALLVQRVARIRPREMVVNDYLHQVLSSKHFIQQLLGNQVGTQIPHITLDSIRKFPFLLPEPAVQIVVAKRLRAHIESTERVDREILIASTRSQRFRRALLAAAFSGRLTGRARDLDVVEELSVSAV